MFIIFEQNLDSLPIRIEFFARWDFVRFQVPISFQKKDLQSSPSSVSPLGSFLKWEATSKKIQVKKRPWLRIETIETYGGWKKSCTTLDGWNPINNGIKIKHLSTGAGFLPSTALANAQPCPPEGILPIPSLLRSTPLPAIGATWGHCHREPKLRSKWHHVIA